MDVPHRAVALLAAVLLTAAAASAQTWAPAQALWGPSEGQVASLVASARSEVLGVVPLLRSRPVAESMRRLVLAKVPLRLVTTRAGLVDRDGYLLSLMLAGASVRLLEAESLLPVLVVDSATAVVGLSCRTAAPPSCLVLYGDAAKAAAALARTAWQAGTPP